jgi:hypothetical protein
MLDDKKLKNLVEENQDYLTTLEELDRSGRLRKAYYKDRVNFTIDSELMLQFRRHCRKNNISMSGKVQRLIEEYLQNK